MYIICLTLEFQYSASIIYLMMNKNKSESLYIYEKDWIMLIAAK